MHRGIIGHLPLTVLVASALFALSCQLIVPELKVVSADSRDTATETGDTGDTDSEPATDSDDPIDTTTDSDNPADTASDTDTATDSDDPVDTATDTATDDLSNVLLLHFDDTDFHAGASVRDATSYQHHATVMDADLDALLADDDTPYLSLNGAGWLLIADRPALRPSAGLTVSLWVYPANLGENSYPGMVVKRRGYNDLTAYAVYFHNFQVAVDIDYETDRAYSTRELANLQWYHVAVVFDGMLPEEERITIYIDGEEDSVHPEASSFIDAYMSDIAIGNLVNGGDVLEGGIDEVAIWHRALSADEIAALAGW